MRRKGNGPSKNLVKIRIPLERGQWDDLEAENVWAKPVTSVGYRIENSPFFAYGVSYGDVVSAKTISGLLTFDRVLQRGGHSTYRILLTSVSGIEAKFNDQWRNLARMGCTFERANKRWLAIDVPPKADIHAVYALLENGESSGVWTFDEGHCGHPVVKSY